MASVSPMYVRVWFISICNRGAKFLLEKGFRESGNPRCRPGRPFWFDPNAILFVCGFLRIPDFVYCIYDQLIFNVGIFFIDLFYKV